MIARFGSRRQTTVLAGLLVLATVAAVIAGERWSLSAAHANASNAAAARAITGAGLLTSELQKIRLLPLVLADYPEVQAALKDPTPQVIARLNARFEMLAERTDAAVIYLVRADGVTAAASNWRLPSSFVGQQYGFRPYFQRARRMGAAEQFALGTVSKRPGLYLARRTATGGGVVVVKIEFDHLEYTWARLPGPTIVRDENGVVIISSVHDWRLRMTHRLGPAVRTQVRRTLQYGERGPIPLAPALMLPPDDAGLAEQPPAQLYAISTLPVPVSGWTLSALEPLDGALSTARAKIRATVLTLILALVVAAGLWLRARERRHMAAAAQHELERQVLARTAELSGVNQQLRHESRERERGQARLQRARDELAQSNRLATLGQITAGVAHEINQPLTAIRTYAENASTLIARDSPEGAAENLTRIVALTERIGTITGELRLFARRDRRPGPVLLDEAVEGALLLTGDRIRALGIRVTRTGDATAELMVQSDRVRAEQILINLLQNATDALAGMSDPAIEIRAATYAERIAISVIDSGPGIPPAQQKKLFSPFFTQKPDGLGLGLVISRDLARDLGGDLVLDETARGASFTVWLPRA